MALGVDVVVDEEEVLTGKLINNVMELRVCGCVLLLQTGSKKRTS